MTKDLPTPTYDTPDTGSGGGSPSGGSPSFTGSDIAAGVNSQSTGTPAAEPVTPHDPIPYDQHEPIRAKAEKLAWAERYESPQQVEESMQLRGWLERDPEGAVQFLVSQLERAGRWQQTQRNPQQHQAQPFTNPQTGEPLPDVIVQETGQRFFSADQQLRREAWLRESIMREVDPLKQFATTTQTQIEARNEAQTMIATAERDWEGFAEFAPKIYEALQRNPRLSLEGAYIQVVPKQLGMKTAADLAQRNRRSVQASTQNPARSGQTVTQDASKVPLKDLIRDAFANARRR